MMGRRSTVLRKDGGPCQGWAVPGTDPARCSVHGGGAKLAEAPQRRCTAICKDRSPCQGWAIQGSDPPRCEPHSGGSKPAGPPDGNQNRLTHGFYARSEVVGDSSLEATTEDLYRRYVRLGAYLERRLRSDNPLGEKLRNPLRMYGESASKLAKLTRLRQTLAAREAADRMTAAIGQALEQLSVELGVDL